MRGDELLRLQVEHVAIDSGVGMHCFLSQSKGDYENRGVAHKVPALTRWCPVQAMTDWLGAAGHTSVAVFRPFDRWGRLEAEGLHPNSFIPLLRSIFAQVGLLQRPLAALRLCRLDRLPRLGQSGQLHATHSAPIPTRPCAPRNCTTT